MTLYSLFKQIKDGNADEFMKNKEVSKPEQYAVWLQQADKPDLLCKKEYILLAAQCDSQLKEMVKGVISGKIKEINIDVLEQGNPLAPSVSRPVGPDNTEYMESLNRDEKAIFDLYASI